MILVTGGTGFIGRHLVQELVRLGMPVRALVRDRTRAALLPPLVDIVPGDLRDARALADAVSGARAVVHLAAQMDGPAIDESTMAASNVDGTNALVRAVADGSSAHVVYVSSAGVYGSRTVTEPLTEADEPRPATAYERSKLAAEEVVRSGVASWTVLRPSGVFGPWRSHTEAFLRTVGTRSVWLYAGPDTLLNPAYVNDVVAAIVFSLDRPSARRELINVGGPRVVSHRQLVDVAAAALGRSVRHVRVPSALTRPGASVLQRLWTAAGRRAPARVSHLAHPVINRAISADKARRLGIPSTPLEEAMAQTVERMRAERRL